MEIPEFPMHYHNVMSRSGT